ncbi:DUF1697 domain-containing protein [Nocardioides marmoribigeumensis]|uniref:Uncharacterized protein (DUF1697 family) n=1 Tax=Nocardioides marmoribigeumensis TaxID=433649 RepID=A0ABU2C0E0_9ACTN|nr:DUF1697 domain-containing protein [Nocardioides marmoribigeumensis]MDR7364123.1 uncharacterized protein (DUF1697 family) [Nocardioides marmoribigeumensis]
MPTYVAFLRAINLGATRKVPMKELVPCLEEAGFEDVATHLATGNVRLRSRRRTTDSVEAAVEEALAERFGFEVPAVVLTLEELARVVEEAEATPEVRRAYVTLLKKAPPEGVVHELDSWSAEDEGARVGRRAVHWWADHDMHAGRLDNAVVEKHLGVATTRSLKVVRTVHEKWGSDD